MLFVFMSQPDFACNSYALWRYIVENTDYETAWVIKRKEKFLELKKRGIRCAYYNTIEANELISEANYVIFNSYTFLALPTKHENQIYVNLWHGSGIKAHDFFEHNLNPRHAKKLLDFFSKVDLMCVHSLDDRFKLSAMLHFDLRHSYVTGQARLDCVKNSLGMEKLKRLFGKEIEEFSHIIFFAPSFRANMSCHSGKFYSENIFRLEDYNDEEFLDFLKRTNSALIYKLHPIEQTAFSGRKFCLNSRCFELTDELLFENDIRYDEILNAFDVMMSDYSSIAYDYLLLDRPIVYLIPDYEEYKNSKGFVFNNIDYYMPGEKVKDFKGMISALDNALLYPDRFCKERRNVLNQRFDFQDSNSAKRCYDTIINYKKISDEYATYKADDRTKMPSDAEQLIKYIPKDILVVDSTSDILDKDKQEEMCRRCSKVLYVTREIPDEFRRLTGQSSTDIKDLFFYNRIKDLPNVKVALIEGGVDYEMFSKKYAVEDKERKVIGFAGTIDNRIYFAMVQCLCEAFPDYDIVFAGHIFGDFPVWLNGYDNLHYIEASYDELPAIINSFSVAILPFFARHKKLVPVELFQYLAAGKMVVTSDMPNLPECSAICKSKSVADAVECVKYAIEHRFDDDIVLSASKVAKSNDWRIIAEKICK